MKKTGQCFEPLPGLKYKHGLSTADASFLLRQKDCRRKALLQKGLNMSEHISLTDTPRALREHGATCSYMLVWKAVVGGNIPAERIRNRWHVRKADLPAIAQILTDKT